VSISYKIKTMLKVGLLKLRKGNDLKRWSDESQLLSDWEPRTEMIFSLIPKGASVLDCGAGKMILKKYLEKDQKYTPLDLVDRGNGTIICDLNAKELPLLPKHDVAVFSGVLEYIYDIPHLIRCLHKSVNMVVASYGPTDGISDKLKRIQNGWVNHFSTKEFIGFFEQEGFQCEITNTWQTQILCRFVKSNKPQREKKLSKTRSKIGLSAIKYIKYVPVSNQRIGYIGWLGHGNLGDEAMYEATRLAFNSKKFLPYKYHEKMQSLEKFFKKRIYNQVMLGGGTLINTPSYEAQLRQAQKMKYPTIVFGSGVRNPEFWDHIPGVTNRIKEWVPLLEQCELVGVRGPISSQLLEQYGFHKTEVIGDPALYLARPMVQPKAMSKKLGLNIGISYGNIWGKEEEVLDFIVNFALIMIDKGWDITLVPVWDQDVPYSNEAARRINKNVKVFQRYNSIREIISFIESCDIFIGEKLHSVILACCAYTPSIMLEYRPKCRDFMASLDLQKYNMRTDSLNNEKILSFCEELYENNNAMQKFIYERVNIYKKKIDDYSSRVKQMKNSYK
jgi:polysaccharide pyruvyl transferase WcaK-like protein